LSGGINKDDNILDFGASISSNELDDLTSLDLEIDQDSGLDKILPTGNAYTSNTTDSSEDSLDDALSFLDLADDDEEVQQAHIGTKLDLARAYLDMGDVEGARHTLEEVVIEGNDDQKREAEELLQQTG
jgi:pilus assembly protein FimV